MNHSLSSMCSAAEASVATAVAETRTADGLGDPSSSSSEVRGVRGRDQRRTAIPVLVPGTEWERWRELYHESSYPMRSVARSMGAAPVFFHWTGGNSRAARHAAAEDLVQFIEEGLSGSSPVDEPLAVNLIGFSHGGNVAALATRKLRRASVANLVTIGTPVLSRYQPSERVHHIHIYNPADLIQVCGGESLVVPRVGSVGRAGRTFAGAMNVAVPITEGNAVSRHGNLLYREATWRAIEENLRFHR